MKPNEIIGQFEIFKYSAQKTLCEWLNRELQKLKKTDWWQSCVLEKLTYEQRKSIKENNVTTIRGLDFAQLLNILDSNWFDLNQFSKEARNYVKELQTARNRWSHKSTDKIIQYPDGIDGYLYRDLDTIWRFMKLFNTTQKETLEEIQAFKQDIVSSPTPTTTTKTTTTTSDPDPGHDWEQTEIQKVKRRLRLWATRQHQINAKILTLFLQLQREGVNNITEKGLRERYNNHQEFLINFQQMKVIAPNNHGKIFDVINDVIKIWEPIKEAVEEYKKTVFKTSFK
jgi:hypothetical protein